MKDTDIQWHPGFVAAINLELIKNRNDLMFEKEYNLNTKPLEIDLLIIRKNPDIEIDNKIGRIFRGHNILEYKSPKDQLNIDVYYKATGYACLYKFYGETVDSIKADDITVSLIRDVKPVGLFEYFDEHHYSVSRPYEGIYYIDGPALFPTQVIVTKELDWENHIWLKSLSEGLKQQDMKELLEAVRQLTGKYDRELADSVLEVSIRANEQVIEKLKGDESMSQALLEIIEPVIAPQLRLREEAVLQEGLKKGLKKGIQGAVKVLRNLGYSDAEIKMIIQQQYSLSSEESEEYM